MCWFLETCTLNSSLCVCTCLHMCVCMCVYMRMCLFLHACTCVVFIRIFACVCVHLHACVHVHVVYVAPSLLPLQSYGVQFVAQVYQKHVLAKTYFSRIAEMVEEHEVKGHRVTPAMPIRTRDNGPPR